MKLNPKMAWIKSGGGNDTMGPKHGVFIWATRVLGKRVSLSSEVAHCRMALMEIRLLISAMVLKYTWTGAPDKPGKWDEEMRPFDALALRPWNNKCVVNLKIRS